MPVNLVSAPQSLPLQYEQPRVPAAAVDSALTAHTAIPFESV